MSDKNKNVALFAVLLIFSGIIGSLGGCNFDDIVQTTVPPAVQRERQLPPRISLGAAREEYQAMYDDNRRSEAQFRKRIQGAELWRDTLGSLTMQGLDAGMGFLGPVAPFALPAITGVLGALGIRRPGDVTNRDKERAFNKGLEEGRRVNAAGSGV